MVKEARMVPTMAQLKPHMFVCIVEVETHIHTHTHLKKMMRRQSQKNTVRKTDCAQSPQNVACLGFGERCMGTWNTLVRSGRGRDLEA